MKNNIYYRKKLKKINGAIGNKFKLFLYRDGEDGGDFQDLRFFDVKTCEWVDGTSPLILLEQKRLNYWVKLAEETRKNLDQKTQEKNNSN